MFHVCQVVSSCCKCEGMSLAEYYRLSDSNDDWFCRGECALPNFSDSFFGSDSINETEDSFTGTVLPLAADVLLTQPRGLRIVVSVWYLVYVNMIMYHNTDSHLDGSLHAGWLGDIIHSLLCTNNIRVIVVCCWILPLYLGDKVHTTQLQLALQTFSVTICLLVKGFFDPRQPTGGRNDLPKFLSLSGSATKFSRELYNYLLFNWWFVYGLAICVVLIAIYFVL